MKASLSRSFVFSRTSCARRTSVRSISEALINCDFTMVEAIARDCNAGCVPGGYAIDVSDMVVEVIQEADGGYCAECLT